MTFRNLLIALPILALTVVLVYVVTGRPAPETSDTDSGPRLTTGQSASLSSPEEYQELYERTKAAAAQTVDPEQQAILYLDAAAYLKKFTTDTDTIVREYAAVYENQAYPDAERGLALLKISQQANGQNRYDLIDPYLEAPAGLSAAEKNYQLNQKIYAALPIAMVYANLKIYEARQGTVSDPAALYQDVAARVERDLERFPNQAWLTSLIPDTVMSAATLYAAIDAATYETGVPVDTVVDTYERALALNRTYTQNNPTKDYIYLELINYLLKNGRTEAAAATATAFTEQLPSNMIRSFIGNGGLDNGRFPFIANDATIRTVVTNIN